MLSVATTSQIRNLEADWISKCDTNWGQVLMELAGQQAAKLIYRQWLLKAGRVLIVCGNGNNGGDGLVIARYLHNWQVPVIINFVDAKRQTAECKMSTKEASVNQAIAKSIGIETNVVDKVSALDIKDAALIVDALLGTGVAREVEGLYKEIIDCINETRLAKNVLVVAVDVPSGVNTDDGQIMGTAIVADNTITFGYIKVGLLCHPAAELCGNLHLIDIGLPALTERTPDISLSTVDYVSSSIPERKANSNKGTFGTSLTIAGSIGMSGSAF